jgi:hypothetical protein
MSVEVCETIYQFGADGYVRVANDGEAFVCVDKTASKKEEVSFIHWTSLLKCLQELELRMDESRIRSENHYFQSEVRRFITHIGEKWYIFAYVEGENVHVYRHYRTTKTGPTLEQHLLPTNTGFSVSRTDISAFVDCIDRMMKENVNLINIAPCDVHGNQEAWLNCYLCNPFPDSYCNGWSFVPRSEVMM